MLALALGRATAMARAPAGLPAGIRVSDHVSLGVIARTFPLEEVRRCLLGGLRWLSGAEAVRAAGKSGISQARARLGEAPLRRLHERLVRPVATRATKGARYREWRLVSLDGSCLEVADTTENAT